MSPLVSIITVTLNAEDFVEETIKSVVAQTFTDYEHIVFDGFSTDTTVDKVKGLSHPRLRLVQCNDKGIYDAMNKAIDGARGEWLYFLNAGDTLHNSHLLQQLFETKQFENVDLLSGLVQTKNDPTGVSLISGKPLSLRSFYVGIPVSHQGAFIRRSMFSTIGLYTLRYTVVADQEWFVRFFRQPQYRYRFTPTVFAYYETVGFSYRNRLKGIGQMLEYSRDHFPWWVETIHWLRYPVLLLRVKTIKALQGSRFYTFYRQWRYGNKA